MRFATCLALFIAAASLAACNDVLSGPVAGGHCTYETSLFDATVKEVDVDGATLEGPEGPFWVSAEYLGALPHIGDTLTLQRERIIEGTCTPEIYTVMKRED